LAASDARKDSGSLCFSGLFVGLLSLEVVVGELALGAVLGAGGCLFSAHAQRRAKASSAEGVEVFKAFIVSR
jgi:hypothetical protein